MNYLVEVAHPAFGGDDRPVAVMIVHDVASEEEALDYAYEHTNTIDEPWFSPKLLRKYNIAMLQAGKKRIEAKGGIRSTSIGDLLRLTREESNDFTDYWVADVGFSTTPVDELGLPIVVVRS